MSDHHYWYVTGRTLRLALVIALFASISVINPASAVEASNETAQETVISNDQVTVLSNDQLLSTSVGTNTLSDAQTGELTLSSNEDPKAQTEDSAVENVIYDPGAIINADGTFSLPKTGELLEVVLAVKRDSNFIIPAIFGYERDGEYFIPVKGFSEELQFPVTLDKEAQRVEGRYFGGNSVYYVDLIAGTYSTFQESIQLPEGSYVFRNEGDDLDDIYVSIDVLNDMWPLAFELEPDEQVLKIGTARRLPFELAAERAKRQEELERRRADAAEDPDEKYIYVPNGFNFLGPQIFTLSQSAQWRNDTKALNNSSFVSGRGDILGGSADYAASFIKRGSEDLGLNNARFTWRRTDFGNNKLLPFGLKVLELGDTQIRSSQLVSNSIGGKGVFISSDTKNISQNFDDVTIRGTAEPGWEVEIYREGVLIDFGTVNELGEYRFDNIPLNFGGNRIKLILYGPQGQIEERTEEYNIGRSLLKPGEISYQAGIVKTGNTLLNVNDRNDENANSSKSLRVSRGLNQFITTYASLTDLPVFRIGQQQYATIGADFIAFNGRGKAELYKQLDGGHALDFRYGNTFLGVNTLLRGSLYSNFESQQAGIGNNKRTNQGTITFGKSFTTKLGALSLGLSTDFTNFETQDSTATVSNTQGLTTNDFGSFSHSLTSQYTDGTLDTRTGQFSFSKALGRKYSFSNFLSYTLEPKERFTTTGFNFRYDDNDKLTANFGLNQSLEKSSTRNFDLGASYKFKKFRGNFGLDWDNKNGFDVRVGASTTLGPEGENLAYAITNEFKQLSTGLTVKLYHDINGDGVFNEGDQPVPYTRLQLSNGSLTSLTDENGEATFSREGGEGFVNITLDRETLHDNSFLVPARKSGFSTILRRGTKPFINFPLVMSGSIDGTLISANDEGLEGHVVQLVDEYGELIAETSTISDGFYVFELVRTGRYIVQLHPSHRIFVPPQTVTVSSEDLFAYGVDLRVLEQVPTDEAAAVEVERDGRVAHTYHDASVAGRDEKPAQSQSDSGVQSVIRAVRVGEYLGKTRLVLDLSGPLSYQVSRSKSGYAIYIDLPSASTSVKSADWTSGPHALFSSIEIHQPPRGGTGTQIKLNALAPLDVHENALLPANNGLADRIYIDFTKAK